MLNEVHKTKSLDYPINFNYYTGSTKLNTIIYEKAKPFHTRTDLSSELDIKYWPLELNSKDKIGNEWPFKILFGCLKSYYS